MVCVEMWRCGRALVNQTSARIHCSTCPYKLAVYVPLQVPMVPLAADQLVDAAAPAADQLVDAAAPAADQLAFTGACRRTGRRAAGLPTT